MTNKAWIECTLDEIVTQQGLFSDGDWVEKKDQELSGEVRLIQLADIGDGFFRDKSNKRVTHQWAIDNNCSFLKMGDILIARMPEPLGRATIFPLEGEEKYITAVDVAILRTKNIYIDQNYLLHQINSPAFRNQIDKLKSGTTRKRISRKNLNKIPFQIAPLPEQRAIVSKIEELFSELDKGEEDLKKAQEQLKIYRQAVLKKAFEGELTNTRLNRLAITELGTILTGSTPTKKDPGNYDSADYNFYKPTDLDAGINVISSNDFLSKKGYENSRQVPALSILVTCIGATIGKTGLIKREGGFNQQINAIVPFKNYMPEFIFYQATSIDFQTQIKTNASSTTLPILNKGKFSKLRMNVCSPKEQHRIVKEIESRLSVCDSIEASIRESLDRSKSLRQSILKKAFEGTLLSEEEIAACKAAPDYEPASVLLERIKAEKKKK